jgi:hypothetical protein
MAGRRRSGFHNDIRTYTCCRRTRPIYPPVQPVQQIASGYKVTFLENSGTLARSNNERRCKFLLFNIPK